LFARGPAKALTTLGFNVRWDVRVTIGCGRGRRHRLLSHCSGGL